MEYKKSEDIHIKNSLSDCILFIHGIFSSHIQFAKMINMFSNEGYSIYAVSLKGHGMESIHMTKIDHRIWLEQVNNTLNMLLRKYKNVYIISHSLGTLLTVNCERINEVKKCILLSPAARPKITLQSMKLGLLLENEKLKDPFLVENRKIRGVKFKGLKKVHAIKPLLALFKLIRLSRNKFPNIELDTLIAISKNDETVRFSSGEFVYKRISSKNKQLFKMVKSYHAVYDPEEEKELLNKCFDFISK